MTEYVTFISSAVLAGLATGAVIRLILTALF